MITAIKFVSVPVQHQDRALAFYTDALGFTIATDQPFSETQRWIELKIPGADTRLVLFTPDGHEGRVGGQQPLAFVSANVEATCAEFRARGVEIVAGPDTQPWGTYATFKDSEGNQFVLSSK